MEERVEDQQPDNGVGHAQLQYALHDRDDVEVVKVDERVL